MKLSSEQWKKGIADSHYTGVANLRNVRIDDVGVLRVMNKPQIIFETNVSLLDIKKDYYETNFNWYGVIGEDPATGNGGVYSSKKNRFQYNSNGVKYSGGEIFRNYFIPFPAIPNTDAGYMKDTDLDGDFDVLANSFETLVTKGQTQTQLTSQYSLKPSQASAILTDSIHVVENLTNDGFKIFDGDTELESVSVTSPRDIVKVTDTTFIVIFSDRLELYNTSATLLNTLNYDFTRGDSIQHLEGANYSSSSIVVLTRTKDYFDFIDLRLFNVSGSTISQGIGRTVLSDVILNDDPHLAVLNEDVVVLYNDFTPILKIYEGASLTAGAVYSDIVTLADYGPMVGSNDSFFMFGNRTSLYNWNDTANEITLGDSDIIAPTNVTYASISGDYVGLSRSNGLFNVYKINVGQIDKTHSLIGLDDVIYYSNGNYVGSIIETAGQVFDPSDNTTYNVNPEALDLPAGVKITALANYGEFLAIGTQGGYIYFWDRTSQSFRVPVNIGEPIASLKSKNNLLYAVSQSAGNVYIANLSSFQKLRNLSSLTPSRFDCQVQGMDFFDDGTFIGNTVESDETYSGIWIYKNSAWTLISSDEPVVSIGKSSPNEIIYATENSVYALDISGSPRAVWSDDEAYIVSPMEISGTVSNKSRDTAYSMYFDNAFKENEYVKLYYRTTTSGEWQHIQTMTSEELVADSGLFAFKGQLSIPRTEQIQYKIVLNTTSAMVLFNTN